jgi:hypothetical protein
MRRCNTSAERLRRLRRQGGRDIFWSLLRFVVSLAPVEFAPGVLFLKILCILVAIPGLGEE